MSEHANNTSWTHLQLSVVAVLFVIILILVGYIGYQNGVAKVSVHHVFSANSANRLALPVLPQPVVPQAAPVRMAKSTRETKEVKIIQNIDKPTQVITPVVKLYLDRTDGGIHSEPLPYLMPLHQEMYHTSYGGDGSNKAIATYQLTADGSSFTITNLSSSDSTGSVTPYFSGITEGQVIPSGQSTQFKLICPDTRSRWVDLKYYFKVAETGETFTYLVKTINN